MLPAAPAPAKPVPKLALAALALVAAALYLPFAADSFIGDDFDLILSFQDKPASYFLKLLVANESGDVWKSWGIDPAAGRGFLRPLKIWLLAADFAIWGVRPLGYHLTSIALFVGVVLAIFFLLRRLLGPSSPLTWVGAWIAAIHPLFSEIVPFITAREESLVVLLVLGALLAFLRHREDGASPLPCLALLTAALMTKESGLAGLALLGLHDLAHGRLLPRSRAGAAQLARLYLPLAAIVAAYFGMRWAAFGNFTGGDAFASGYTSWPVFLRFHRLFGRALLDRTLCLAGDLQAGGLNLAAGLAVILAAGTLLALAVRAGRLSTRRWRELLFFGPLWYLGSTTVLFGSYFAVRRTALPLLGLVVFLILTADSLRQAWAPRREPLLALLLLATSGLLFLPPGFEIRGEFHLASQTVAAIRADIEARAADLPPGSAVLLQGVPQWEIFPYYFGWALQSALSRPFSPSDLAHRLRVWEPLNAHLIRATEPPPERFDLAIRYDETALIPPVMQQRYWRRLQREGLPASRPGFSAPVLPTPVPGAPPR